MLEVSGLRAAYGRIPILHGIDLEIGAGEVVGILGHNGMGKTTLMKTLIGLVPATGGSIVFDGADVTREKADRRARRGMGYVPAGARDLSRGSAFARTCAWRRLRPAGRTRARSTRCWPISRVSSPCSTGKGGALSGGEQQILAIARCLCTRPRLILLDEPTEGIQPSIVEQIAENLAALRAARGLTVVLVEQNLDFTAALSTPGPADPEGRDRPRPAARKPARFRDHRGVRRRRGGRGHGLRGKEMFKTPTVAQLRDCASDLGMNPSDDVSPIDAGHRGPSGRRLSPIGSRCRTTCRRCVIRARLATGPMPEENPHGAWYVKTAIKGARRGKLAGKRVAIKDNICVAGVPMMNGASVMEGYVPDVDATVVTRASSMPGARSPARRYASISASRAPAPPAPRGRSTTRASTAIRRAARRRAAPPSSRRAMSRWRSEATRRARSASRRAIAGSTA